MIKLSNILVTVFLSLLLSTASFAAVKKGKGDVQMTENSFNRFLTYIRAERGKKPMGFILSSTGTWSTYWYCAHAGGCQAGNYMPTIRECEDATSSECGLFARRYTILWKNGINPGKGKASSINSRSSDAEIRAKLTELGFLGGSTSSAKTVEPKITVKKKVIKKKSKSDERIVKKLKDLKELLDSGVLTKEEFEKAKKKLLN
ncbi:SHOCT domain-containing protein [Candidatus Pelagibacter sp. Uisw_090]|uniref:SHOCT domain-containing protein n=1 Tax=Candidatus Pelagibacter sp. Uisw_090 TaxID=3230993 RepID=UPI0039ED16AC